MDTGSRQHIELVVDALATRVDPLVDHETLTAVVEADFKRCESARTKDFVPVLVERDIRQRLMLRDARHRRRNRPDHARSRA